MPRQPGESLHSAQATGQKRRTCARQATAENDMNLDRIEGGWMQLSGKLEEHWCALVGDQSGVDEARHTQLAGRVRVRHSASKVETERQLKDFLYRNRDWNLTRR
jgi:uncharacterized protein YjbJ (UPF0337 family)